jgi:predicted metalloprotease
MHRIGLASVAALALGGLIAGCGSSSSSSSTTSTASSTTTTTSAAAAHLVVIRGVASPPGATKATTAALRQLKPVPKASGIAPRISGLSTLPLQQQLSTLDGDLNSFWGGVFAKSNIQWPQAQEAFVSSSPVQTPCTNKPTIAPTDPWFLCQSTFYWTLPWIQQNVSPKGDVVLAFNVGLFWSFHVQDVLGFTQALQQGQVSKAQYATQTLCLTGVWVRTIGQRNLFEQGDTQALQGILDTLQGVDGIGPPDVTQQSLASAFASGYNNGAPGQCAGSSSGGGTSTTTTSTSTPTSSTPSGPSGL